MLEPKDIQRLLQINSSGNNLSITGRQIELLQYWENELAWLWSYRRKLVTAGIGKAAYRGGA